MSPQRRPNELELDDAWQRGVFERLIAPVLEAHSYRNQIVFIDIRSPVAKMLQLRAHVDAVAQLPHGKMLSIEIKIVRWPGVKEGRPSAYHWRDLFLETWSCSVGPNRQKGWMHTSAADVLLWCQCGVKEERLDCFPFPFSRLRAWFIRNVDRLPERRVANVIDGRALWSIGRLAPISTVCRDLRVEGFRVTDRGLISDLYGAPILRFLRQTYNAEDDFACSIEDCYAAVRERKAQGGKGWPE
jgi:hypothetical protein